MSVETPDGLRAEREPPSIGIGPDAELEADLAMPGAIGVVGVCLSLTLGVVVMVCDRFQMPRSLVFLPYGQNTRTRFPTEDYAPIIAPTSTCFPPHHHLILSVTMDGKG